jgi:hypothetical protein
VAQNNELLRRNLKYHPSERADEGGMMVALSEGEHNAADFTHLGRVCQYPKFTKKGKIPLNLSNIFDVFTNGGNE